MALLKDSDREQLSRQLEELVSAVKLVSFTQALDCDYCPLTQQVLEELTSLSDKIQLETHNFAIDREKVAEFGIARVPGIALVRLETELVDGVEQTLERDYGIRYYGVPAGYEFSALVSDVFDVSRGDSGLSQTTKSLLSQLRQPLHLQVFTTPT